MPQNLPPLVTAAISAANAGDIDGFLKQFTPEAFVNDWGHIFKGSEEIRRWSQREFIGAAVSLDVHSFGTRGNLTVVSAQVGGSGFNGPSNFTFATSGNSLLSMTITG